MRKLAPVVLMALLCACSLRHSARNTPPPPKPVAAPAPAEPVSIPQTTAQLPPPQPVDPAAIPPAPAQMPAPAPPENPLPTAKPSRRPSPQPQPTTPAAPKPEQAPSAQPAAPSAESRPRIQEILPPEEQKRLQESADARKKEVAQLLAQVKTRRLSAHQRSVVNRIQSFVALSDEAAGRGDFRQCDALAERAQILARELQGGR